MNFKMKMNHSVLSSIYQGNWMITVDMQDTYFNIPSHPDSRKYLRFVFQDKVFSFRLCFSLSMASQVFILYLDNWLL